MRAAGVMLLDVSFEVYMTHQPFLSRSRIALLSSLASDGLAERSVAEWGDEVVHADSPGRRENQVVLELIEDATDVHGLSSVSPLLCGTTHNMASWP